jgi:hypothetical protein
MIVRGNSAVDKILSDINMHPYKKAGAFEKFNQKINKFFSLFFRTRKLTDMLFVMMWFSEYEYPFNFPRVQKKGVTVNIFGQEMVLLNETYWDLNPNFFSTS